MADPGLALGCVRPAIATILILTAKQPFSGITGAWPRSLSRTQPAPLTILPRSANA